MKLPAPYLIAQTLQNAVTVILGIAFVGVFAHIPSLTDWGGDVPMRSITAIAICMATYIFHRVERCRPVGTFSSFVTGSCVCGILLIVCASIYMVWYNIETRANYGGAPSLGSLASLALCAIIGLLCVSGNHTKPIMALSGLVTAIGFVALVGHAIGVPLMYYRNASGIGMAIPTALCFVLLGVSGIVSRSGQSCPIRLPA